MQVKLRLGENDPPAGPRRSTIKWPTDRYCEAGRGTRVAR